MYRLYDEFAHRYDLHTPPGHYQHDHAFVIGEALRVAPMGCRLLDIGCGTGVLLEAAIDAGIDGYGIDSAPKMIEVARRRLGNDRVRVQRMQDLCAIDSYNIVSALSWTIHYCETETELDHVIRRCRNALLPRGQIILQVADDERLTGAVNIDREPGPSGRPDDTLFIHRFRPIHDNEHQVLADYVYVSGEHRELVYEQHLLRFASPSVVAASLQRVGFVEPRVITVQNGMTPIITATLG